jgi:hypothetical protein
MTIIEPSFKVTAGHTENNDGSVTVHFVYAHITKIKAAYFIQLRQSPHVAARRGFGCL